MAMQTPTQSAPDQKQVAEAMRKVRDLYADAPELAKAALDRVLPSLAEIPDSPTESAGRVGARQGKVSEFTMLAPFAPGGARRLRGLLRLVNGNFSAGTRVGTLHNMRFVYLENDTKLLFATAYDGQWDPYIDDFATKIPDEMDVIFSALEGWPGIRSPKVKDWIFSHAIPAEGWYVAHPNLTVAEVGRLQRVDKAVNEALDKIQ
jgi:hypothetical protein